MAQNNFALTFLDGKFNYLRIATLVVKHVNFLLGWQVSVFLAIFFDGNFSIKNVRAVLLHATRVTLII